MKSVVYACNDAYIRQTLVSMVSLIQYNPEVKIYLIGDRISKQNEQWLCDVLSYYHKSVIMIGLGDILPDIRWNEKDRHPKTVYAKLFMENVIKEDRVLYLDSDVIVRESLDPLFERPMENEYAAGVMMPYSAKLKERISAYHGEPYICDGVVLFNLSYWKRNRMTEKCVQYILRFEGNPPMLSEGVLNHVCRGRIGILEPKYNLMPSMIEYSLTQIRQLFGADCYYEDEQAINTARETPAIIHFMNELYNRPWYEPCGHPWKQSYLQTEREALGKCEICLRPLSRHTRYTMWLKKHLPFSVFSMLYHIKNRN